LITTEAQNGAGGKQLARDGAQGQLDAALSLTKSLAEVATKQRADTLEHGPEKISPDNAREGTSPAGHLDHHLQAIKAWEAGTNTDKDGTPTKEEPGQQPILVLSAPAGIAQVTPQNLSLSAGTNLDQTAQRDTNQTSGRRWLHNVGQHMSLFVNGVKDKIAAKFIAAQGKVQVQAQHGEMELTAERDLTMTSTQGKVTIAGKEEVLLTSGGGYIRLKDGNIDIHCPDLASFKAAKHSWTGPDSLTIPMPQFPQSVCLDCLKKALQSGSPFVLPVQ
jgi:type VI secretion system secreted protein VgrG